MVDLVLLDRIAQRAHDVRLPDDLVEGLRPVTAVEAGHSSKHPSQARGAASTHPYRVARLVSATTTTLRLECWRRAAAWAGRAISSALAAATWVIFSRAFLNYDTLYALIWGRDLAHGHLPDFEFTLAPTPHPLAIAVGALASLFGTDGGYTVMLAIAPAVVRRAALGAFSGSARFAFAWPVGLLAALVVATRVPFLSQGTRAYVDIPFLALVVLAAVLEVQRPSRGWAVLVLLALAGLVRPEAWLLAAAYWVYLAPALDRQRAAGHAGAGRGAAACVGARRPDRDRRSLSLADGHTRHRRDPEPAARVSETCPRRWRAAWARS